MNIRIVNYSLLFIFSFVGLIPSPAAARVAFTGYSDFRFVGYQERDILASPNTLGLFGLSQTHSQSRTFDVESVGIFATTKISDQFSFLADFTYRDITYNDTEEIRVQYAYVEYQPWEKTRIDAGKVTLPFGFFNENMFYPFQRKSVNGPIFQTAILGAPIADMGVLVRQDVPTPFLTLGVNLYGINGYGHNPGSTTAFRSPTIGRRLVISSNLDEVDNNDDPAYGGRISLKRIGGKRIELGASFYEGDWDPASQKPFRLAGAHLHAFMGPVEWTTEYLKLSVDGDLGFAPVFNHPDWGTEGYFTKLSWPMAQGGPLPFTLYGLTERYVSRPDGGGSGREYLQSHAGGVALRLADTVTLKIEGNRLDYILPLRGLTGEDVEVERNRVEAALVATF
jgi:hypothetical protein